MKTVLVSFVLVSVLGACAGVETSTDGAGGFAGGPGVSLLSGAGGAPSCAGFCNTQMEFGTPPNVCHCDASCANLGDCCGGTTAFFSVCGCNPDGAGGQPNYCGAQHFSGCHCDASCANLGDCCPLKSEQCGRG